MSTSFTSWEEKLNGGPNDLEHHGIPGMRHGVRRYQNEDGSLTALGRERYGVNGKGASAGKMMKDINDLDRGYANVEAHRKALAIKTGQYAYKMHRAQVKGKEKKAKKYSDKAMKTGLEARKAAYNKKEIEALQYRIIGQAARKGYKVSSEPVKRYGKKGQSLVTVDGQNFIIRKSKRGANNINIVNYSKINKNLQSEGAKELINQERKEREQEYYRKMKGVKR